MAKISASLPDELKARLDAYIKEHPGTGISDVVQTALEQFLSGGGPIQPPAPPPPVTPPAPPPPTSNLDQVARDYVLNLAIHVENMRMAMASAGLWAPPPLVPPPWWQLREGEAWTPKLKMERKQSGKKKNPPE